MLSAWAWPSQRLQCLSSIGMARLSHGLSMNVWQCVQIILTTASSSRMIVQWDTGPFQRLPPESIRTRLLFLMCVTNPPPLHSDVYNEPSAYSFLLCLINTRSIPFTAIASPSAHTAHLVPAFLYECLLCLCSPLPQSGQSQSHAGGSTWQVSLQSGSRESWMLQLHAVLFILLRPPPPPPVEERGLSIFRVGLPAWWNFLGNSQTHPEMCFHGDSKSHHVDKELCESIHAKCSCRPRTFEFWS